MSVDSSQFEGVLTRVRELLNREKVRLWLPPFTTEDGKAGTYPEDLIVRYSGLLGLSNQIIAEALEHLRSHALEKLASKKKYLESGLATLKVHLAGHHGNKVNFEISLKDNGAELRKRLGERFSLDPERLKLICNGQVMQEDIPLEIQSVKNNSQILVIQLCEAEADARRKMKENENIASSLTRTRQAAEALSKRTDDINRDQYFLEIRDQEGRPIKLPDEERKALALAMTLHEKGKSILKTKNYAEALVLLLEADKEFSQCRSQILEAVDNYAILCLDVVWCYLCLRSINDLPTAEEKLRRCEDCFERSYGKNLERLTAVRGESGQELALFVRLYVLQAVCAYHRGQYDDALALLTKAEEGSRKLSVDDDKLTQLVSMGFSCREARLGLRACSGDVTLTVDHITRKRQEKQERDATEREERKKKGIQRKLGKTASGEWVNTSSLEALVDMGFPRQAALEALRQSNNSMDAALQTLQDHPELLDLPPVSSSTSGDVPEEIIAQIASMGFDVEMAREALRRYGGGIQRAIEQLVANGGVLSSSSQGVPSTSGSWFSDGSSSDDTTEDPDVEKAVKELVPDLEKDGDAYLDLTLDDEASVIAEYKALLLSCGYGGQGIGRT